MINSSEINLDSCRVCLSNKNPLCPLFKYKLSGNYAEMLTAIADVKVAVKDGLPEKICSKCCITLEKAYLLKTVAERSDRKLRKLQAKGKLVVPTKKIAFDSFGDIKSEIPFSIKPEPKWEMEIDLNNTKTDSINEMSDMIIANTVIRKVDPSSNNENPILSNNDVDLTWTKTTVNLSNDDDNDYFGDSFQDDDLDADYVPEEKHKKKKTKLVDTKPYKVKSGSYRKIKVLRQIQDEFDLGSPSTKEDKKTTSITCFPLLKNGLRGAPIVLRRPKDATILKVRAGTFKRPGKDSRLTTSIRDGKMKDSLRVNDGSRKIKGEPQTVRVVRNVTNKPREKLVCPVCGILTYTLGSHIATHEEKKKFTCSHCPKTFTQRSNLIIHSKQHTGVKDHICEVCGAGFYSQKSLVRHNLIHKGERPFPCNLCNKRFIVRCDLNRHLRIHSGYKPYKCNTCAMSFNAKHQLQNHERMHTGERPYSCQVCNLAFSYKVNLNNHVYKVHGINLKFKSIHIVTEEILRREMGMANETRVAISHIMPQLGEVPTPAAHETVPHHSEY